MNDPLRIFIGWDPKEAIAYHVLAHSIIRRATRPVTITPIALSHMRDFWFRQRGPTESTEFSITRFLVPYLSSYTGHSIYMDCDMLCLADITKLWDEIWETQNKAVLVCQHVYDPVSDRKMDNQVQTKYPRKNWSSLMVFNNELCRHLTLDAVTNMPGLDLHRFHWTSDDRIGSLDLSWNWLVGEYDRPDVTPKIVHYTLGGPWLEAYRACDFATEWFDELDAMLTSAGSRPRP